MGTKKDITINPEETVAKLKALAAERKAKKLAILNEGRAKRGLPALTELPNDHFVAQSAKPTQNTKPASPLKYKDGKSAAANDKDED